MKNMIKLMKNNRKKIILFSLFVGTVLLFVWYQNNHIVSSVFNYKSSKLSSDSGKFNIVQISDLHNASFGKDNKKLIDNIESLEPDIIVITGDIIDSNHTDLKVSINFVKEMTKRYLVYYVTGNHEYWLDESEREELFASIREAGAVILNNEKTTINMNHDSITLIGLDDHSLNDATLSSMMEQCDKNELTVVLAHEPQYINNYCDAGADLVLTGHAHGGQVILPFIGALIAPGQGFLPQYTAGEIKRENTTMYISRGLGNSVIPLRLFNYPEIVSIEVQGYKGT